MIDLIWLATVLGLTLFALLYVRLIGGSNGEHRP